MHSTYRPSRALLRQKNRIAAAQRAIHGERTLTGLSETFKVLGDPTRLKICLALAVQELCVGDLADLLAITESGVSHQLRLMKTMRLVKPRREGKMTYYVLDDGHIQDLIALGVRHIGES